MRFGPFALHRRIGVGGMGEVWSATRELAGGVEQDVVVKRIRSEHSAEPGFAARFVEEARVAARLNHPALVRVLDFGQVDGAWYLAMERVDGADLSRVLRGAGALPPAIALYVAHEVARGLAAAHALADAEGAPLGLVHRDVCAANILLSRDGQVKLTDFGVASLGRDPAGEVAGHVSTMSPEQLAGGPVDARSDIYSLGVVLYEMLVGEKLFGAGDPADPARRLAAGAVVPPSRQRPSVPERVDPIVMRALADAPADRFPSAEAMRAALRSALEPGAPDLQAVALRTLLPGWLAAPRQDAQTAKTVVDPVSAPTVLGARGGDTRLVVAPVVAASAAPRGAADVPERVGLRPWQMALVFLLVVGGWFSLSWIAEPYDGSFVKDDAPPLNLVPLEPVPAAAPAAAPEAPTPWAPPEPTPVPPAVSTADSTADSTAPVAPPPARAAGAETPPAAAQVASPRESAPPPALAPPAAPEPGVGDGEHAAPAPSSLPPAVSGAASSPPTSAPAAPAPAAPDPAAAVPVTVHLSSGWGRVRVDGRRVKGTTPLDLALPPGTHRIQVETPSTARVYTREISVDPGSPLTVVIEVD